MSNQTAEEVINAPSQPTSHELINGDLHPQHVEASSKIDSNDDNINNTTTTSTDVLAKGISSIISSVIRDFDSSALATSHSQLHLSSALDRLTSELDKLLEDAPLPFIMQHAAKLSSVRKRVSSLNSVLRSIQHRLDNIDRMLSVGVPNGFLSC
ncbi:hypothetical protein RND81_12G224200 [Saponaria officinalis]|uniref:Biogenesis of lysosome-related organelles complex 1 subunit 7 n=1 Tax=Saponaria officinalis TaxID=3572 RepID=A0AAW1HE20_SAPOF